jgi:hypothetical protein
MLERSQDTPSVCGSEQPDLTGVYATLDNQQETSVGSSEILRDADVCAPRQVVTFCRARL